MKSRRQLLTLALLLAAAVSPALAQIPRTISFQGVLANAQGVLVPDGNQQMTIAIYDQATGGTALFSETLTVPVVRGVFNAVIGSSNPAGIPGSVSFDQQYWLGVTIAGGSELAPRTPFTSVPYALNAAVAQRAIRADMADTAAVALTAITADTAASIRGGHVISVNGKQGAVELLGAGATTIVRNGNQLIIRSTDTSGGAIRRIDNFDGSLVIDPPTGPFVTMFIREGGVQTHHLRDLSITTAKIIDGAVTNPKIATGAVDSRTILNGTILTEDIGNNQVLASKIGTEGAPYGFALLSNGTATPVWADPIAFNIPYVGVFTSDTTLWHLTNNGSAGAGYFAIDNPASSATALTGTTNGTGIGVLGQHTASTGTAAGVRGESNSTDANAVAVHGVVTSTSPGGFSSALRGTNNGTGGLGIGVYGSQAGSGWGVYGTTPNGIGVHGSSANGFGLYGLSTNGTGIYGLSTTGEAGRFEISNNANANNALNATSAGAGAAFSAINTGTGKAGNFLINNAANNSPSVDASTNGGGASVLATNSGGGPAGHFRQTNAAALNNAIYAQSVGTPPTIRADNSAAGDASAGLFWNTNAASTGTALQALTQGTGRAIFARRSAGSGLVLGQTEAVRGDNNDGPGVAGTSNTGVGVYGASSSSHGVWGVALTAGTAGVLGRNDQVNGFGVWGQSFGGGIGIYGSSQTGHAGQFEITNAASTGDALRATTAGLGRAVYGQINNTSNIVAAVRGETNGGGYGIFGQATGNGNAGFFQISNPASTSSTVNVTTNGIGSGVTVQLTNASNGARGVDVLQAGFGPGVFATSAGGNAVWGITSSISSAGVIGDNTFGEAVVGRNRGGNGVGAVVGRNDSSGYGVRGFNTKDGIGVLGQAGISGGTGVGGRFENVNAANTSTALQVATNGIGSGISVSLSNAANGARGIDVTQSGVGPGVFATSAGGNAVWGITSSISAAGVIGDNTFGEAVVGRNRGGNGVGAVVGRNDSSGYGVRGFNTKNGIGVLGQAGISGGTGVAGRFENVNAANTSDALQVVTNSAGNAARFTGNVVIAGNLNVSGTVAKGGGSFKIDHPLDPKNKYLYHSFVESPDMLNIYNGNVTLDASGSAVVTMPEWFDELNTEFRYQLTAVGGAAPNLHIAEKIAGNTFRIAGGAPGIEVSWQVTGVRNDPYARVHRIQVEVDKPEAERGTYLHPEAYEVAPRDEREDDRTTRADLSSSESAVAAPRDAHARIAPQAEEIETASSSKAAATRTAAPATTAPAAAPAATDAPAAAVAPNGILRVDGADATAPATVDAPSDAPAPTAIDERARTHRESPQGGAAESVAPAK